jgi:hypothetical protein
VQLLHASRTPVIAQCKIEAYEECAQSLEEICRRYEREMAGASPFGPRAAKAPAQSSVVSGISEQLTPAESS